MLKLFATVRQAQSEGDWHSIPGLIGGRLGLPTVGHIVGYVLAAVFVAVSVVAAAARLARAARTGSTAPAGPRWRCSSAASSLLPWYVAWALPLAALSRRPAAAAQVVVAMTGVVLAVQLLGYIPHGGSLFG